MQLERQRGRVRETWLPVTNIQIFADPFRGHWKELNN